MLKIKQLLPPPRGYSFFFRNVSKKNHSLLSLEVSTFQRGNRTIMLEKAQKNFCVSQKKW